MESAVSMTAPTGRHPGESRGLGSPAETFRPGAPAFAGVTGAYHAAGEAAAAAGACFWTSE